MPTKTKKDAEIVALADSMAVPSSASSRSNSATAVLVESDTPEANSNVSGWSVANG